MKKISAFLLCVLMIGLLGGCGGRFDASGYVRALLDNSYKNDSTAYVEQKIGTAQEAAELYEQGLEMELEAMISSLGEELDEEQEAKLKQIFADILKGAKYTVGEAVKEGDDYTVTVTYEKMQVFAPALEAYMTRVTELITEWSQAAAAGEEPPSDDEMMGILIDAIRECFEEALSEVTYAAPQTTTIRVELIDQVYSANDEDLQNLETSMFDVEEALQSFQ